MVKKTFLMIAAFMLLAAASLQAQDVKGKYILRSVEGGSIVFIYPQEGYKSKEMASKLVYDLTYSSVTDSVAVNFTYTNKVQTPAPLDSIVFVTSSARYAAPASMLYIEPKKSDKWENRASANFPGDDIKAITAEQNPAQIILYIQGKEYLFEIPEKVWRKNTGIINKVFDVAKYNY
ncbi:hypothetical protein [Dysgonomonas sp. 25]|uniref:hypothetical protein n=1 Tax=Dysgonomonas sp. 25 TaxID=2302933 RepID=UPI0013D580A5|nr:hypothetical protein [Dysgonomonas sp. 25]NDV68781.1 hypothetical protein [Dysgonomonas sp. 25]